MPYPCIDNAKLNQLCALKFIYFVDIEVNNQSVFNRELLAQSVKNKLKVYQIRSTQWSNVCSVTCIYLDLSRKLFGARIDRGK
jgi:hypothetical protein